MDVHYNLDMLQLRRNVGALHYSAAARELGLCMLATCSLLRLCLLESPPPSQLFPVMDNCRYYLVGWTAVAKY